MEENSVNIKEKLEEIEKTDYWDSQILDINISYFGDEVDIYIASYTDEDKDKYCWRINFMRCCKVNYETDAQKGVREKSVKDLCGAQLYGYSGHDISLSEHDNMFECKIILSNMNMNIICQQIEVSKVLIEEQHFFWNY